MTVSDTSGPRQDDAPPRRSLVLPVGSATVLLTALAVIAGLLLGDRHRKDLALRERPTDRAPTAAVVPTGSAAGPRCAEETRRTAVSLGHPGDLSQLLKVVTDNGTTIWICADPAGRLYYQGKTGGPDAPLVEGRNGLFLSTVTRRGPDAYHAVANDGNRIDIDRGTVRIQFAQGGVQTLRVVTAE